MKKQKEQHKLLRFYESLKRQPMSRLLISFFGVAGVLFCYLWISFGGNVREDKLQQANLQSASPLAAAQAGQNTFVEGNISGANPAIHGKLVSFITEEYIIRRRSDWDEISRNTPPLQVQAADGVDYIENNNYQMVQTPETVADTTSGAKIRSRGFIVGNPITAFGKRDTDRHMTAETIFPGTREQYLEYLSNKLKSDSGNSLFFLILGSVMLTISIGSTWIAYNIAMDGS